jgi:IclR family acetate operon transcriptional repressor
MGKASTRKPDAKVGKAAAEHYPSPSTATVVDLLQALDDPDQRAPSLRSLSERIGAPRSTVHRILQTLESKGFVTFTQGVGYEIGMAAANLGVNFRIRELRTIAEPILNELNADVHETVNLAIPHDDAMLIVAGVESTQPIRTASTVGQLEPLQVSALGKSYLAALAKDATEQLLVRLDGSHPTHPAIDPGALERDLANVRKRGYALDDEEQTKGMRCVGAAIVTPSGKPIAAISVSAPATRLTRDVIHQVGGRVQRCARTISVLLS